MRRAASGLLSVAGLLSLAAAVTLAGEAGPAGRVWHWERLLGGIGGALICFIGAGLLGRPGGG